jgi:hypothetical protein
MTRPNLRTSLSIIALTAVAASGASAASAATIGTPEILGPGSHIPIDFGGYKEPANKQLPKNYRIVRVHADVTRGEKSSTVLTAPKGFRAVTIGFGDGHEIGGVVDDSNYPGKRSVRVKLFVNTNEIAKGETGSGTLYLLARRA